MSALAEEIGKGSRPWIFYVVCNVHFFASCSESGPPKTVRESYLPGPPFKCFSLGSQVMPPVKFPQLQVG